MPPQDAGHVQAKEQLHLIAAEFASGVMAAFAGQIPPSALDPTFQNPTLQNLLLVGWGAYKAAYAAAGVALSDTSWVDPLTGVAPASPATPAAPVATTPAAPVTTAPGRGEQPCARRPARAGGADAGRTLRRAGAWPVRVSAATSDGI